MSRTPDAASIQTWHRHRAELLRFVVARVHDPAVADDIVHDVLLKALSRIQTLEDPSKLRAWLYGIARNAIVDHFRARRPTEPLPEDLRDDEASNMSQAEQDLAQCLVPLLDSLPAAHRQALVLAEVDGLPQREIAKREHLSLSGAKSRVQRGRRMLRAALLRCCRIELDRRGGVTGFKQQSVCACGNDPPACGGDGRPAAG